MSSSAAPPLFSLPKRYEYDNETLGGGQGAVYICKDKLLDRLVAVKALHTMSNAASLSKEIEARAKIESKHVAEIYEVLHTSSGVPFALVLEYLNPPVSVNKATYRQVAVSLSIGILFAFNKSAVTSPLAAASTSIILALPKRSLLTW